MRFGIALHESGSARTLEALRRADALDVPVAWLTSGGSEQMTLLAAAAATTRQICLGTAIVPTYPRHPVVLAQQVAVIEAVSPGRFILGVGPSHQPIVEGFFGIPFVRPLAHLREYVAILRQALEQGTVDFEGEFFKVHFPRTETARVPILISALREASFRVAGEISDGGISWICPASYLARVAMPALVQGAVTGGRQNPLLIGHCFVCVNTDREAVRADARERLALYPRLPFYQKMLALSGDEEAAAGHVSERMIDSVVVQGDATVCADGLRRFAEESRSDEVIVSLMAVGSDRDSQLEAAMKVVASL